MEQKLNNQNCKFAPSFYDKYIQDDENLQAKIKPIINEIQENRVIVKELHVKYGVKFSEMMNSYRNRVEELKGDYEDILLTLKARQNSISKANNELLENEKF